MLRKDLNPKYSNNLNNLKKNKNYVDIKDLQEKMNFN